MMKDAPSMKRGQFVRVVNRPPYQHPNSSPGYFATHGDIVCNGESRTFDLLFTPNELRRAAHRAQKNREDIPAEERDSLLDVINRWLGL